MVSGFSKIPKDGGLWVCDMLKLMFLSKVKKHTWKTEHLKTPSPFNVNAIKLEILFWWTTKVQVVYDVNYHLKFIQLFAVRVYWDF